MDEAVNNEAVQDTAPATPAVEESKLEVVTDGAPLNPNNIVEPVKETEGEPDSSSGSPSETETEDDKGEEDLAPKSVNRFQKLANDNNQLARDNEALRQQLEQLESRKAQVAQEQQLLDEINPETGEYYTPGEVERIAYYNSRQAEQQRLETQQGELQVRLSQSQLANETQQVLSTYSMFDAENKEYNPELTSLADGLLSDSLLKDPNTGDLVGSKISPVKLYQTIASVYEQGVRAGQIKGQKSASSMIARSDVPSSAPTRHTKSDEKAMSPDEYAKTKGLNVVWQ